jgi:predicted esterase
MPNLLLIRLRLPFVHAIFGVVCFVAALLWARERDPYFRVNFPVKSTMGSIEGIAIARKPEKPRPVIVYLHGSGGEPLKNGRDLRQLADHGFAVVTMHYTKTNRHAFDIEMKALTTYLEQQTWADTDALVWIGVSRGAQCQLSFALAHTNISPRLLVRIGGGWVTELDAMISTEARLVAPSLESLLLIHGERDSIFSVEDTTRLATWMRKQGVGVDVKILENRGHGLREEKPVVIKCVAEYCQKRMRPPPLDPAQSSLVWIYWLPLILWAGVVVFDCCRQNRSTSNHDNSDTRTSSIIIWGVAAVPVALAIVLSAFVVSWPELKTTDARLRVTQAWMVSPAARDDFSYLASMEIWGDHAIRTVLDHAELSRYRGSYLYQNLDESMFHEYVVSPVIAPAAGSELHWRRKLWETFYPRVRKKRDPMEAAVIVARLLRSYVEPDPSRSETEGVETVWRTRSTNAEGWERIYVAALRSVGIAARLSGQHTAEIWTGTEWRPAPRPLIEQLLPIVRTP